MNWGLRWIEARYRDRTLNTKGLVDLFESQDSKIIEIKGKERCSPADCFYICIYIY